MLLHAAFRALLLISGVSALTVQPPTNLTVSCQNLKVTVSWQHSGQQPQTSFRVNIRSLAGHKVINTTDHQYDLSHFILESEDRYMGYNYVNVTAIQGGSLSKPVQSESFTFNSLKTTNMKCELDFPPVDLNLMDSGAIVSFINPLIYYSELNMRDTATFKFNVSAAGKNFTKDCTVEEEHCRLDFSYPEGVEEKCVSLTGQLSVLNSVVLFRKIDRICPSNSTDVYWIVLIIVVSVTVLTICVVTITICKTSAWTMKTEPLPDFLVKDLLSPKDDREQYAPVPKTNISPVTACKNPSVSSEEDDLQGSCAGSDYQSAACLYLEIGAKGLLSDDSADDSEKTECVLIDLEEEEEEEEEGESPYDRPQILQVDMGDGDMVTAYSKR